ncbi:hypothetical protein AVEN_165023-1 [Araneus ventricosus]|uniref:Uncharacterized protein n=1 Tax=Araneus ventricosus TaxID=182803 RepID=A0A4Y2GMP3_ARAVE|nr:hypothetical protein AVEN_165023-1 [Araneus ventricosus]
MDQYQHLCRIAGGINKNIRRLLNKTVIERTLCHGAAAWGHNMTSRLQKKLDSIRRLFLLYITGAYRTTPTAALQVVTGLQPSTYNSNKKQLMPELLEQDLHLNFPPLYSAQQITRAKAVNLISPPPPIFLLHNKIYFAENQRDSGAKVIYTDGTDEGAGNAYCILEKYGIITSWQSKLGHSNSVFQAEIFAIKMTIEAASSFHRPIKIRTDRL